jgi:hypothetical protein
MSLMVVDLDAPCADELNIVAFGSDLDEQSK